MEQLGNQQQAAARNVIKYTIKKPPFVISKATKRL